MTARFTVVVVLVLAVGLLAPSLTSATSPQFMKSDLKPAGRQLLAGPATRKVECAQPGDVGLVHWDPTECTISAHSSEGVTVANCKGARPAAACCREEVCLAPFIGGCADMDTSIECGFSGAPDAACCPAPLEP